MQKLNIYNFWARTPNWAQFFSPISAKTEILSFLSSYSKLSSFFSADESKNSTFVPSDYKVHIELTFLHRWMLKHNFCTFWLYMKSIILSIFPSISVKTQLLYFFSSNSKLNPFFSADETKNSTFVPFDYQVHIELIFLRPLVKKIKLCTVWIRCTFFCAN